ncbi:MAG: two-component system, NtrC family, sensor kinase [Verrucomicrobiota bacterium]|jgi:PAS domain S-box-containing protein
MNLDFYFSREYLKAAVLISLLTVWVLVGLFYYLNYYTKRRYFTIWTAAWLFYALWITLRFGLQGDEPQPWLLMLQFWCVGVSAVFLFWGGQRFLGERVSQKIIGLFLVFLLIWSYVAAYQLDNHNRLGGGIPLFTLIAAASLFTARSFLKYRHQHSYMGATLLTLGFTLWGIYMAVYPFLDSKDLISIALFISAAIQLLVAVSMIILVLEEVRSSQQLAAEQLQLQKREQGVLRTRITSTEERYQSLFDQAGEAIIITDPDNFEILELNRAAEHLLGITSAETTRRSLKTFFNIPDAQTPPDGAAWFERVRQQRSLQVIRKNGSSVEVEMDGTQIDFDGRPSYQFFLREMTERVKLEQQLRQAEKLSALGQMISGVAHELNNPLAVIKGYVELILAHHDLPPKTRVDLERVAQESIRAAKLVGNFLSFSREQSARRELVNINELIQRVIGSRRFDLAVVPVRLETELAPDLPPTAADPDQIQQLLINLMNNALHALLDQTGVQRLKISTRVKERLIQILVEDSGPGVPPELVGKIFEPFFTTKEVGSGTGLGLSIAHSIMTEHQGNIRYQTSSLGGAGFVLEFPILGLDADPAGVADNNEPAALPLETAPASANILVLDDERGLAELLGELLKILGHTPTVCNSPAHALEFLERQSFDLIISDFRMPGMNGREFYDIVKQKYPALQSRVVFVTGDLLNEETHGFLQSTGNPHLGKPFNLTSVKQAVAEVLTRVAL